MKMPTFRESGREADVTLGPCPGCDNWQLDYTDAVARSFCEVTLVGTTVDVNMQGWHDAVEAVLREHLDECPELRALVGNL